MSKLLETFQELNLSNYGPDDVDQLNAWAIDAYAELSAIKAQEPVAWAGVIEDCASLFVTEPQLWKAIPLYAAPVSEAKAQGEYGDAYQGAREDLAIWKRRALEAEKALQEERIITERLGNALNEENGPTFMGEPVFPAKAQGVVQWPEADEIMQMAFEEGQPADDASGYCFELEEFDLFIERLMSEVARLNAAHAQQVSVPDDEAVMAKARELFGWAYGLGGFSDAVRDLVAFAHPAAPAADAGLVEALELAANRLDRLAMEHDEFWRGYATMWVREARAALADHRAKGVV